MSKKLDTLKSYLSTPKAKVTHAPSYMLVRLTKYPDLRQWAIERVNILGCSKEAYVAALIAKDKQENS